MVAKGLAPLLNFIRWDNEKPSWSVFLKGTPALPFLLKDRIQGFLPVVPFSYHVATNQLPICWPPTSFRVYYCLSIVEPPPAPEWKSIFSWNRKDTLTLLLSDSGPPSGQGCPRDNSSLSRFCGSLEVPAPPMVSSAMSICIGCSFCLEICPSFHLPRSLRILKEAMHSPDNPCLTSPWHHRL